MVGGQVHSVVTGGGGQVVIGHSVVTGGGGQVVIGHSVVTGGVGQVHGDGDGVVGQEDITA